MGWITVGTISNGSGETAVVTVDNQVRTVQLDELQISVQPAPHLSVNDVDVTHRIHFNDGASLQEIEEAINQAASDIPINTMTNYLPENLANMFGNRLQQTVDDLELSSQNIESLVAGINLGTQGVSGGDTLAEVGGQVVQASQEHLQAQMLEQDNGRNT